MEEQSLFQKINSSKFVICALVAVAAACETIASMVAGYPELSEVGFWCTAIAAACYVAGRTFTDCTAIKANANTTQTVKTVTATTSAAKTVEKMAGIEGENGTK